MDRRDIRPKAEIFRHLHDKRPKRESLPAVFDGFSGRRHCLGNHFRRRFFFDDFRRRRSFVGGGGVGGGVVFVTGVLVGVEKWLLRLRRQRIGRDVTVQGKPVTEKETLIIVIC